MKKSYQNKIIAILIAVLLIVGMSPVTYAARLDSISGKISIEKTNVKLKVGESITLGVTYEDFSEDADIYRARVSADNFKAVDVEFGWEGSDIETITITGLADGASPVYVSVGRIYTICNVTVGKGDKTPEQIKREEAAVKAAENVVKNDKSELGLALADALKKSTKKEVTISTNSSKNPSIPVSTLKALEARATQAKKNAVLRVDSFDSSGKALARMLVMPDGLLNLKSDFKTGITVDTSRKASLGSKYIASVKCAHTGSFGMFTEIAVKLNVPKDVSKLSFYNVNAKGTLVKIEEPVASLDKDGYLSFYTKAGGEIVILNGAAA